MHLLDTKLGLVLGLVHIHLQTTTCCPTAVHAPHREQMRNQLVGLLAAHDHPRVIVSRVEPTQ